MRIGVISNPRSLHNRDGGFSRAVAECRDLLHAQPRTTAELEEALLDFRQREVEVIAVSGGDGTIREILTALPRSYGDEQPHLALLPSGKTNLVARVVGGRSDRVGNGNAGLARLLDAARGKTLSPVEWPVLDITWRDLPERRVSGFLFGTAGFTAGTRLAYSHVHTAGINNASAVILSIAAIAASALFGSRRHALVAGEDMRVGVDGAPTRGGRHFLTLATTLDRLILGLTPFWGEGEEPVRWLDIPAPPQRLMAALLPTLRGRPRPWMLDAGYASGRAREMVVELSQPFVVDGELFEPGTSGIVLSAHRRIGLVVP